MHVDARHLNSSGVHSVCKCYVDDVCVCVVVQFDSNKIINIYKLRKVWMKNVELTIIFRDDFFNFFFVNLGAIFLGLVSDKITRVSHK